jgi:hypothetical protein
MKVIFLIRQLMERCREQKKDLHMVFIDLEKAYDKVTKNVVWWILQKHNVLAKYITLIKDMYDNVVTSVRTTDGDCCEPDDQYAAVGQGLRRQKVLRLVGLKQST